MDTTDAPKTSPEPIFQELVDEADDATRSALTPAQSPEPGTGPSESGESSPPCAHDPRRPAERT
jgi:hypothetical protein